MWTRRQVLAHGGAALAMLGLPRAAAAGSDRAAAIEARPGKVQLAPEGFPATEIWGYDGAMPGPELRLRQGERLRRDFLNNLPQSSSIHWHGIRIDNAMDGAAGLTQDPVEPGTRFAYDFVAPDAGTYWYHAHMRSVEQVGRGLYGALIVEEADAPDVDREEVLILDDWMLNPETAQIEPTLDSSHDRSHGGQQGNYVATNGQGALTIDVKRGERLRLRLINAANSRIFALGLLGLKGWTLALDGMPLPAPEPLDEVLVLGPGQRADLVVDVVADEGEEAHLVRYERREGLSQVAFRVAGAAVRAERGTPAALPPNPGMEPPALADAVQARLNMEGGAMGSLQAAILDGKRTSFRDMVSRNQFWSFNGRVGMPEEPLVAVERGQSVRLSVGNDTAFAHAMHLHGMHFREVAGDAATGPLRDTLMIMPGETRDIAFVADNPGDWLFHCHMLAHAASGMTTWLKVT